MKEELQSYIYTEKLLAQLYRRAAALTANPIEKQSLLNFSQQATRNAEVLNNLYRREYGTNFDPMIPDAVIQGSYRDVLNEILAHEIDSFLQIRRQTYFQNDIEFRDTMRAVSDVKLGHILTILAIITNLNNPENKA